MISRIKGDSVYKRYLLLWQETVLPLCFTLTGLLNIFLYYLGLAFEENVVRAAVFAAGCVLYAVLCGLSFLCIFRQRLLPGERWAILALPLVFYGICFLLRLKNQGFSGSALIAAGYFGAFCLPAFFAGVCCAVWRKEDAVFPVLDKLSFLALPAVIIYVNGAVFHCNPFNSNRDFGILSYMTFAYAIMPFLLGQMVCFCKSVPLQIPFYHKEVRRPQWIRGGMIFLFWTAVIASGTRGAYFCVLGFCGVLLLIRLCRRDGTLKRTGAVVLAVILLLAFFLFVYAPKGFHVGRMEVFLEGLAQGELVTSTGQSPEADEFLDELIAADGDRQIANRPDEAINGGSVYDMNLQIRNRGTLYALAAEEFLKAPITGMGPGGYTWKYGTYPHNVLLELLCETGLVGAIPAMALILWAVVRLWVIGKKRPEVSELLLFFIAFAVRACISGTFWNCPALLCALGYGLAVSGKDTEKTL